MVIEQFFFRSIRLKAQILQRMINFILLLGLLTLPARPVFAQEADQMDERTFAEFRNEAISLEGPQDSETLNFNLPAHWKLNGDVTLQLQMTIFLPQMVTEFQGTVGAIVLTVNGKQVSEIPLQTSGDATGEMTLPLAGIPLDETGNPMDLRLMLESYMPSQPGQPAIKVLIHPTSTFKFSYTTELPDPDLIRFPHQFIQSSFEPDHALLVIPDQPSIAELQSALIVAAGLGRLSKNLFSLELVTVSQLTPDMQVGNHLILVGKPEPFLALKGMIFPSPIIVRSDPEWTVQFLLPDRYEFERTVPEDGLVQLINSPWSSDRFILFVSGETDLGVLKAGQAVSSGSLRTNVFPNLAIIKETRIHSDPIPSVENELSLSNPFASFVSDPTLSSTVFVLPRDDVQSWGTAIQLAGWLGAKAGGPALNLTAFYGDELPNAALSSFNILAIGRASSHPYLAELGDAMPVPFEKGKDVPEDTGLDIVYRMSKDYDSAGYLEILASPENQDRMILTVLGDDATGIQWAANALLDPAVSAELSGDFALIDAQRVYVVNSADVISEATPASLPVVSETQSIVSVTETTGNVPVHELVFWQIGVGLLILLSLVLFIQLQRKSK